MSADRWTICPKCAARVAQEERAREEQVRINYGKVSVDEYFELVRIANEKIVLEDTLREDYEIGVYGDEFFISYGGMCEKCGWEKEYTHKEKVP